jgi:RNA polymerase sigma-70 factor (ECF subfamily)
VSFESKPSKSLSPEAVAQLVGGHREFLAFLERRVESRAAAEDILQAAFARGLERGRGVQDEKVVAWFYRVRDGYKASEPGHTARFSRARARELERNSWNI